MNLKQQFILIGSILSLALFVWVAPVQAVDSSPDLIDVVEIVDPAPFIIHTNILPGDSFLHPMTVRNLTGSPQDIGMKLDIDLSQGIVNIIPFELEEQLFVKIERVGTPGFITLPGGGTERTLQQLSGTLIELGSIPANSTQVYKISFVFNPNAGNEYQNTKVYFNVAIGLEVPDITASLQIFKINDSVGDEVPGNEVEYTLRVKALNGDVNKVVLTDLPPLGFVYVPGSATGAPFIHEYASPGVWNLGDIAEGETKTVTYRTKISDTQDDGLYKDLAWAKGITNDTAIFASDPLDSDNFVGTQVRIAVLGTPQEVELDEDTKTETKTKERVLGITTYLPATGSNTWWLIISALILAFGIGLMIAGRKKKENISNPKDMIMKMILLAFVGVGIMFSGMVQAAEDPLISVRIEEPKSPINVGTFNIGFVTLDIAGRDLDVQCYQATAVPISTDYANVAGGNSGNCIINSFADGDYEFYARASSGESFMDSAHVKVAIKSGTPSTPVGYNRDGDSCNLSFTTANDGLTAKVELYRSVHNAFTADASTFSTSVDIGPNAFGSIADPLGNCGDYLYAIRAVSAAGIGSGFVGDQDVNVETNTRTRNITNETIVRTGGAIPVAGGGAGAAVAGENVAPEATEGGGAQTEQGVEGAETKGEAGKVAGAFSGNRKYWILGILAGLGIIYYAYRRSRRKKQTEPLE